MKPTHPGSTMDSRARTVRMLDGAGETIAKRKAWPTVESLG